MIEADPRVLIIASSDDGDVPELAVDLYCFEFSARNGAIPELEAIRPQLERPKVKGFA